jgi:hypothetical protein
MRRAVLVLLAAVVLLGGAPARSVAFDRGIQNDFSMAAAPDDFYARAGAIDATWVRVMLSDAAWKADPDGVVARLEAAHDAGYRVLATGFTWMRYPTVDAWAAFLRRAVGRLAPYVDAWAPMNEANHWAMRPATARGETEAHAYWRVLQATLPLLHAGDPSAQLVVGDLAPGNAACFMRRVYAYGGMDEATVLGVHPYQWESPRTAQGDPCEWRASEIADARRFARQRRLALWVTEYGMRPWLPAGWLASALDLFAQASARKVFFYDVGPSATSAWNTRMTPAVIAAINRAG